VFLGKQQTETNSLVLTYLAASPKKTLSSIGLQRASVKVLIDPFHDEIHVSEWLDKNEITVNFTLPRIN